MGGHKSTYITLTDLVGEAMANVGETIHMKEDFLRWGIKYAKRHHMDEAKEVKTRQIQLTPWKAIELPDDCVDWIQVGVQCGNMIKTFVHDHNIALDHECVDKVKQYNKDCNTFDNLEIVPDYFLPFYNATFLGEDPGKLFGNMLKDNGWGYFTENNNQGSCEIQFKTDLPSTTVIYLEYISSGFDPNEETLLHPYAADHIRAGIEYEYVRFKWRSGASKYNRAMLEEAKMYYEEEFDRFIDRIWDLSVEDIIEHLKSGYKLTPKRG